MTEILGYIGAVCIGLVLGLTGGGGSILTVPILVYLLAKDPVIATGYSLFVLGTSSAFGAFRNIQKKMVNFSASLVFAIPALLSVFSTRKFLVPALPEKIFEVGGFVLTKDIAIMLFFAVLMLLASISMIRGNKKDKVEDLEGKENINYPVLFVLGAFTGLVTGIVGAGGGFIIVPILVLLAKLPMKRAVATSLFIVAINSLIGFLGDVSNINIEWKFLLTFTSLAVVGIFIGIYLNRFIDGEKLKRAFGWFVLLMSIFIAYKEMS